MSGRKESIRQEASRVPWMEWVVAAAGLLLFIGSLGVLLVHEARTGDTPPSIAVRATAVTATDGRWLVEFSARNTGDQTAADVEVVGTLTSGGGQPEESRAVLDYLPGDATGRGGLYFTKDPRAGRLELRATGYRRP